MLFIGQDSVLLRRCRELFLHIDNCQIETLGYCDDALVVLRQQLFDLVLVLSINAPWRAWPSLSEPTRFIGAKSAMIFLDQLSGIHIRIPVLVVTQWPYAKEQALANGAFAVVDPFDGQELERVVSLALSAVRPTRGGDSVQ